MSIFEIGMLVGFGLSWPLSILKSLRSSSVAGKSIAFMVIVFFGYLSGILHKVFYSFDGVIFLYILNALMVMTDFIIVMYKRKISTK